MATVSLTTDQLEQMVTSVATTTVQAIQVANANGSTASFADASFTYNGVKDPEKVEAFLAMASSFKKARHAKYQT